MKRGDLRTILEVLSNYDDDTVAAEHDEIFLGGPHPDEMGTIHRQLIENAGAFWNDEYDCWQVFA